jgi:hypothetical protein
VTLFPFLAYLAPIVSATVLLGLALTGSLRGGPLGVALLICAVAVYAQFFGELMVSVGGMGVQTLLAVYLLVRWRLSRL